ncbi:glycerophosphodiester phosphodiesterase, partial [Salmonella enterica subsp. enterica serovar Oslo]|nr:glycerophosphodiester phosphodiesterase [Salmonella enterica subsp. enterica serovar Oslo]
MQTTLKHLILALMLALMTSGSGAVASEKVVIAHRGASCYLPEHTL